MFSLFEAVQRHNGSSKQFKDIIALQSSYANVYSPTIIYESVSLETCQYLALPNFTFLPSKVTFAFNFSIIMPLVSFSSIDFIENATKISPVEMVIAYCCKLWLTSSFYQAKEVLAIIKV